MLFWEDLMNDSRRDFIKKSMMGLAGLSVSSLKNLSFDRIDQVQQERHVIQRTLGRTGLKTSIVGIGVLYIPKKPSKLCIIFRVGISMNTQSGTV